MRALDELLPPCDLVAEGAFLMGTPDTERSALAKRYGGTRESYAEESPRHEVNLPAFWIMRTPVTNELYLECVRASGARVPVTWRGGAPAAEQARHPVVDVSWDDA